jgi:lactoylglutathione lyase
MVLDTTAPPTLLTHIALPVRDLDATLAFYERYTTLVNIHQRQDPETGLRTVWLANERDVDAAGTARFVIVLICGSLPTKVTGDIKEEYGFLRSISHLGLSLGSRQEVDRVADLAREEGCLLLGPMYRNEVVGYICIVTDPDGNNLEFSVEQVLG